MEHVLYELITLYPRTRSTQSPEQIGTWISNVQQAVLKMALDKQRQLYLAGKQIYDDTHQASYGIFSHSCFEMFMSFLFDHDLVHAFACHQSIILRHRNKARISRRKYKTLSKRQQYKDVCMLASRYTSLLTSNRTNHMLQVQNIGRWIVCDICEMVINREKLRISLRKMLVEEALRSASSTDKMKIDFFLLSHQGVNFDLLAEQFLNDYQPGLECVTQFRMPQHLQPLTGLHSRLAHITQKGMWPSFTMVKSKELLADDILTISIFNLKKKWQEFLMKHVEPTAATEIQHGRLPIGLKIHCRTGSAIIPFGRGGFSMSGMEAVVLPPITSIELVEHIFSVLKSLCGNDILDNPDYQIQVCSPGRLEGRDAAILGVCTYLGSPQLRRFNDQSFKTTQGFSSGERLIIYGAGVLETHFPWWPHPSLPHLQRLSDLDLKSERTDVLACSSMRDIDNVNLVATLLIHRKYSGYWRDLGHTFVDSIEKLLDTHLLSGILSAPWVISSFEEGTEIGNTQFLEALTELSNYAFEESERIQSTGIRKGILFEMNMLIDRYRTIVNSTEVQSCA